MKNLTWMIIILIGGALIFFFLISGSFLISTSKNNLEISIDNAIQFLNSKYSKEYIFDDPYIYCEEQLPDCHTPYRMLDTATTVVFFTSEETKAKLLPSIVSDSEEVIKTFLDAWKNQTSENIPIDLYAIFVYYFPNETQFMLQDLINKESPEGEWEPYSFYDYYPNQNYRKITDEAWPIFALAKNRVEWKYLKPALDKKKEEAEKIINNEFNFTKTGSYTAMVHILEVFYEAEKNGYDISGYKETVGKIKGWLASEINDNEVNNWTVIMAEGLYWLSEVKYEDKSLLESLANELIKRQYEDGGWRYRIMNVGDIIDGEVVDETYYDTARVQTTILAILALENFNAR